MPSPSYRQQDVTTPHFSLPFRFGGIRGCAFVNEEDSAEDISDCVKGIIAYPVGTRDDLPDFGIPDLVFSNPSPSTLRDAIVHWEARIDIGVDGTPIITDEQLQQFGVNLRGSVPS